MRILNFVLELCYIEAITLKDETLEALVAECSQKLLLAGELRAEKGKVEKSLEEALSRMRTLEEMIRKLESECRQVESAPKPSQEEPELSASTGELESLREEELQSVRSELESATRELLELRRRVRAYEEALEEKEEQLVKLHTRVENAREEARQKVGSRLTAGRDHRAVRREDCQGRGARPGADGRGGDAQEEVSSTDGKFSSLIGLLGLFRSLGGSAGSGLMKGRE